MDSTKQQVIRDWRPDEESSYCCLLSQHTHLQKLSHLPKQASHDTYGIIWR